MNDEWGDRDRSDDTPARPPQARRVAGSDPVGSDDRWGDEDQPNAAPPRKSGGTVVAIIVGTLLLVGAVGTAIFLVVDGPNPPLPRPVAFGPPPGGFGPGGFGPGMPAVPVGDWQPADDGTARQVRAAFRSLGHALQKPDFDPDDHFDVADMVSVATADMPRQARWGQAVHDKLGGQFGGPAIGPNAAPLDPTAALRTMLRNARPQWRKREWEKPEIRTVIRYNNGQIDTVRAMVWQARPDGPPVKCLWSFTPAVGGPGGFGGPPGAEPDGGDVAWKIQQWEDLDSGLRGTDELALDLIGSAEQRWDLYAFRQLPDLHRRIEDGEFGPAEERLAQLARARPVGRFADLCDVADARLKLRRGDTVGAVALLNPLIEHEPQMVCLFPLLCETHLRHGQPGTAEVDCRKYLKSYGANADIHALLAEALHATGDPANARTYADAALAESADHPRALGVLRRLANDGGANDGGEFARRVTRSPKFLDLYKRLSLELLREQDWKSFRPLAEEYHTRRPDDTDVVRVLIQARAETDAADAALDLFLRYATQVEKYARPGLIYALTGSIRTVDRAKELYKRLPDDLADELFPRLVQAVEMSASGGGRGRGKEEEKARQAVAELVALHAVRRPDSPVIRLHEAKALIRDKKWAEAEAKLAGIKTEPNPDGDRDATAWEVDAARTDVYFALKKWDAAVAGKHGTRVFSDLADRCEDDKQWKDLTALVAAVKKADTKLPPGTVEYWSGVALAGEGKHAAAVAEFRMAMAAGPARKPGFDPDDDDDAPFTGGAVVPRLARSLAKTGKAADALALLEKEDFVQPALYAYALTADGQVERAAKYLLATAEEHRFYADSFYRDPDLGPLLNDKPEFAEFRERYPKPGDPPKDDD